MDSKKHAIIIGGSRGIGKAISDRLAKDGMHVTLHYNSSSLQANAIVTQVRERGDSIDLIQFDITDSQDTQSKMEQLITQHAIDVLVFCAGIHEDSLMVFMDEKSWNSVIDTNLKSFYQVVKPVLKTMLLARSGRIIVISSTSGQAGREGQVHYAASKAGLIGAVKSLALECAKKNVLVNAVTPGFIITDMTLSLDSTKIADEIPMKRLGGADEVAGVVSFLASDDASYITGQVIGVNGGIYM